MEKDLSEKWLPRHMKDISASPEVMNHHMIELQPTKKEQWVTFSGLVYKEIFYIIYLHALLLTNV